ncbi:hypothetical protein [Neorhodopirellula pilleata]|uniref:Membrane protein containing DUF1355 n=1 Tax=Neorhodopirellula pilleata TaxID=2714738 RepID=A0A5C6ARR4_9BACT|nr:hypothetical protein [Neorhodopirellula pilleata]TWU01652.1 hypothetical protein Pla100_13870 [Neorhodopirellula pilleata]
MNATETETNEFLSLDHPFHTEFVVLLGLACAAILIWALLRERAILGRRTTALFFGLRIAAFTGAFWMLLAPTSVLEKSTTTRKAVVLVTDASASMTTVDPAGTADDGRWASFASGEQQPSEQQPSEQQPSDERQPIELADRSIAALGIAHRELSGAVDAMQQHGAETLVAEHLGVANQAILRCQTHLDGLRDRSSQWAAAPESTSESLLNRLNGLLVSPEFDSLGELVDMLQSGRTPKEAGWREALPDWIGRVATTSRVFRELADQLQQLPPSSDSEDASAMARFVGKSRSERVASFLEQFEQSSASGIRETADLRWCVFDQATRNFRDSQEAIPYLATLADREQLATQTNLTSALQHVDQMHRDQPIAATFVLSDVAHNEAAGRKPTDVATQLGSVPVYVVPIGNELRLRDIDLVSVSAPTVAMRNDDVVIEAHLGIYQCAGERCTVQLLRGGEVVDFRNVLIESNAETRSVQFEQRVSEIGTAAFQIAVQPLSGEMTNENNFDEIEINVTRSDIKVLLADELPRWEYRYLAQLFRRDPKVELDELLFRPRMIATGQRQATQSFPVSVDQWDHYDVVILGDLPIEHLPVASQESLLQYLRTRSGTVILIAGQQSMPQAYVDHPLHDIVPVRPIDSALESPGQFAFEVTEAGKSHAALMIGETEQATRSAWEFVNQFSPLDQVSRWRTPLPTAQSLISAVPRNQTLVMSDPRLTQSSFLCWQPVGRGRVIYLSGPDTYRLRFLRGDRLHYRFWGQLMRWAIAADMSSGSKMVRIRTAKSLYETDQSVDVEVALLDADGDPVIQEQPDTDTLHLRLTVGDQLRTVPLAHDADRPGHYRADIRELSPGVYQAQPAGNLIEMLLSSEQASAEGRFEEAIATFTVQADLPAELVDTRTNRVLANQVAQATGGQVLPPTAVDEILALTDLQPVVTHSIQREPLWSRWRYLWLIFGCLQTEWIIRKWRGLS